jgi:hypothetical protein
MVFDPSKAFETENGVILNDGTGFFSGSGSPVGTPAPIHTRYYDNATGIAWYKYGVGDNDWRKAQPGRIQDHITLLAPGASGINLNKNNYEVVAYGHINGSANLENNTNLLFQIVASKTGTGASTVRLYDADNATVLGSAISILTNNPEYYTVAITLPPGDISVEVQAEKTGNSTGTLYWACVEYVRTES